MVSIKLEGLSPSQRRRALRSVYDHAKDSYYADNRKVVCGSAITIRDYGDTIEVFSNCLSSELSLFEYLPRGYSRFQIQS